MKTSLLMVMLVAVAVMGGCATITRGTTQSIYISSSPQGATVLVDGAMRGTTPLSVSMSRGRSHSVQIGGGEYEVVTVQVVSQFGGAIAGNILIGGLIGAGVDLLSGASRNLSPASIHVQLEPAGHYRPVGRSRPYE